ncbi:hypothetical protein PPSIR1_27663 [Plesiocystis pacifica SIR-1]|uniref:Uncharacterized protein n=1 Tax=Plesiocystis pacifica SIR-1 TaxID=391625 RepID=A6GEG1_9BACT|nr:hypothetical protein [Plesiocystis pacifica]EDM75733.1 hypothetical protein PPSIR1_27663 [Plesiocystis pacifica SIR-1]
MPPRPNLSSSFVRPWWWAQLGLWLALVVLAPASASAGPPAEPGAGWSLAWEAGGSCPSQGELAAMIAAYLPELEEPRPADADAAIRARAEVTEDEGGWTVDLELEGLQGLQSPLRRIFSAPECDELAAAAALIIAVSLEPLAVSRRVGLHAPAEPAEPAPAPDPAPSTASGGPATAPERDEVEQQRPAPSSSPQRSNASSRPTSSSRRERPRVGAGVRGGAGWGPTPAVYAHAGASVGVFGRGWAWRLDGGAWLPRRTLLDDGRAARIHGWWLGSAGCWLPRAGVVTLPLCAGLELGQAIGRGLSPTPNPRRETLPWVALVPSVGLRWQALDRLTLVAGVEVPAGLVRARFRIGGEPLAPLTAAAVRASLGLDLTF